MYFLVLQQCGKSLFVTLKHLSQCQTWYDPLLSIQLSNRSHIDQELLLVITNCFQKVIFSTQYRDTF